MSSLFMHFSCAMRFFCYSPPHYPFSISRLYWMDVAVWHLAPAISSLVRHRNSTTPKWKRSLENSAGVVKIAVKRPYLRIVGIAPKTWWNHGTIAQIWTKAVSIICLYGLTLFLRLANRGCMEQSNIEKHNCAGGTMKIHAPVPSQLGFSV